MATLLRVHIDPAQERNARTALQGRVEGAVTLLDNPVLILSGAGFLEVQLPDELPEDELRAVIKGVANLVRRPESGILGAVRVTPENRDGLSRSYSTP